MTATSTNGGGWVGQAIKRKEDPPLIKGAGTYVENMQLPGMLWTAIVRSPVAHAKITSIDTSAAAARPGIVAVYTADDLADDIAGGIPMVWAPPGVEIKTPEHWPLARGEVKHVGQAVAVVVGEDRYAVVDAMEDVFVEYDEQPVVVDVESALEPDSPLVWDQFGTNQTHEWGIAGGDARRGDRERGHRHRAAHRQPPHIRRPDRDALHDRRPARRRADAPLDDPDPAHRALHHVRHARHPGGQAPRDRAARRRRLRSQAPGLRRGSPDGCDRAQARAPGQVDGDAQRAHGHVAPRPRPGQLRDDRRHERRQGHRPQAPHPGRPGRVLPDPHAVHPRARASRSRAGATTSRTSSSTSSACSRTSSRPTRSAAPGVPR